MFIGNFTKYLPYWKYHQNKTEITYREYFDIKTKIHLEKKTIKILNLNKISFIKKYFDQNYLKMFFKFIF